MNDGGIDHPNTGGGHTDVFAYATLIGVSSATTVVIDVGHVVERRRILACRSAVGVVYVDGDICDIDLRLLETADEEGKRGIRNNKIALTIEVLLKALDEKGGA